MLTLGIPGDAVTAIIIGALLFARHVAEPMV
jgi:TctA family transporter